MEFVTVQGIAVPALGYGTWELRGRECQSGVAEAIEIGYRHIDTAQGYANEAQVGRAMADSGLDRGEFFLTTKIAPSDFSRPRCTAAVKQSLQDLQTEYVDLMLLHWPATDVPLRETLEALLAFQQAGAIRHIGVSNFTVALVNEASEYVPIFCNQVEYHPFLNQDKLLAQARRLDLMLTAYCPVARGLVMRDKTIGDVGRAHAKSPAQIALRWLIQQPNVSAIPKAANPAHIRENFDIFDFQLTDEQMKQIQALTRANRLVDCQWSPTWDE